MLIKKMFIIFSESKSFAYVESLKQSRKFLMEVNWREKNWVTWKIAKISFYPS